MSIALGLSIPGMLSDALRVEMGMVPFGFLSWGGGGGGGGVADQLSDQVTAYIDHMTVW